MKIPPFISTKFVEEDGNLTSPMFLYNDQLNRVMQDGLSDNGWTVPQQTTANITTIAPDMPNGTLWYDTDTNELKGKINGVVVVIA